MIREERERGGGREREREGGRGSGSGSYRGSPGFSPSLSLSHTHTRPPRLPPLPHGAMMSISDVRFVVDRVLQPTRPTDPYHDEYYQLQLKWKHYQITRTRLLSQASAMVSRAAAEARRIGAPPPPLPPVILPQVPELPLPGWPETRERLKRERESWEKMGRERTKQWSETEHVLGQVVKADISRPRAQLSLPSETEALNSSEREGEGGGASRHPFCSRLWESRQSVQKGYTCFYNIQELQLLLRTPQVAVNMEVRREMIGSLESAVTTLARSLGLSIIEKEREKEGEREEGEVTPEKEKEREKVMVVDEGLVSMIVQSNKGKRLFTSALWFLSVEQRWRLIPSILCRILTDTVPVGISSEEMSVEEKLIVSIQQFFEAQTELQQTLKRQHLSLSLSSSSSLSSGEVMPSKVSKSTPADSSD